MAPSRRSSSTTKRASATKKQQTKPKESKSRSSVTKRATKKTATTSRKEYKVERILASKQRRSSSHPGGKEWVYHVKWAGYPLSQATWDPREHMEDTVALDKWLKSAKGKKEVEEEMKVKKTV
ncbi:hypothetical protein JCM8097_005663 [Rhodosporidiobolus ruineniae]